MKKNLFLAPVSGEESGLLEEEAQDAGCPLPLDVLQEHHPAASHPSSCFALSGAQVI